MSNNLFKMRSRVWLYPGSQAAWHFLTLPKSTAKIIREEFKNIKRGWGSLPVMATIGATTWKTSIFPDKKTGSYLLPLKSQIRKKNNIHANDLVSFTLKIAV